MSEALKDPLQHVNKFNKLKLRQGDISDRLNAQPDSQIYSNKRVPTHNGNNHMNDNKKNYNHNTS